MPVNIAALEYLVFHQFSWWSYSFLVLLSLLLHVLTRFADRYVFDHSDGGGWDAGTASSVNFRLTKSQSILSDSFHYPGHDNRRVLLLVWLMDFFPGWALIHVSLFLVVTLPAYLKHFFSYGKDGEDWFNEA